MFHRDPGNATGAGRWSVRSNKRLLRPGLTALAFEP